MKAPRRLRRAETVLRKRSKRILLVLERTTNDFNHQAVLRTAEGFGLSQIWIVDDPLSQERNATKFNRGVSKGAHNWLEVRSFATPAECLEALVAANRTIWATDLSRDAEAVDSATLAPLPDKLALIMGRESDGVSVEMLAAAERRLYLPMYGFAESFNLTVATALMLQRLFDACPQARGDLNHAELQTTREQWYSKLATNQERLDEYHNWLDSPPPGDEELRPEEEMRRPRIPKKFWRRQQLTKDAD